VLFVASTRAHRFNPQELILDAFPRGGHFFYHKPKTEPNRNFGIFGSLFWFLYLISSVFSIVIGFHRIPNQNKKNRIPNFINFKI
jgi:hypothetical protein